VTVGPTKADRARARAAVAGVALLALALGHSAPATAGSDAPPAKNCVVAEEASVHPAGDGSAAPPKFTTAFYRRNISIDVSLDGSTGKQLPISIELLCDVPKKLQKQAMQLAGTDGIGLIYASTNVFQGDTPVAPADMDATFAGADTATLKARLARPAHWREDQDGNKVPTFVLYEVRITD
jgi:hypothetical protein